MGLELFEEAQRLRNQLACSEPFSANYTLETFNTTLTEEYWDFVCGRLDEIFQPKLFQLILYISIFLIGFSGNLVIIFHILQHGNIVRDLHSAYVLSLSCSDILYLSLVPFQAIQMVTKSWIFGDITCRLFNTLDVFANHASVASITLMCYDRMCAVTKPHSYSHRSKYETRLILSISWLSGFILSIPNLIFSELSTGFLEQRLSCSADFIEPHYDKLFLTVLYVIDCAMPVAITTIMYSLTLHAIVKRHRKWNKNNKNNLGHKKRSINLRMVFLVLSIIATFWLCYLPFWTFNLLQAYQLGPSIGNFNLRNFFIILTYVNSALNPVFYSILPETRRKILMKTLLCRENTTDDHAYLFTDENQKQNSSRSGQGNLSGSLQHNGYANSSSANGIKLHRLTSGQGQSQVSNLTSKNFDLNVRDSLPGNEVITVDVNVQDSNFDEGQKVDSEVNQGQEVGSKSHMNGHTEVKRAQNSGTTLKNFANGVEFNKKLDDSETDHIKNDPCDINKFHANGFVKTDNCENSDSKQQNTTESNNEIGIVEENGKCSKNKKKTNRAMNARKSKSISIPSVREVQV